MQLLAGATVCCSGNFKPDRLLAVLLKNRSDYTEAELLQRRSLTIREQVLGPEHPSTAVSLDNLAGLLRTMGDYAAAEPLSRRALAVLEKKLGNEHPSTAISLDNLAELLEEKGDIDESAELRFKQLAILEISAGIENEKVLRVLQNLAVLLHNSGKLDEAEPLQRESVVRHIKVYGEDGLETAAAYSGLGALLKLKGEFAEAEAYYRKALAIRERELGTDAEATKLVRKRLEELLGNYELLGKDMTITFSGKYAKDDEIYGVSFEATMDGVNIRCRVEGKALQDIDPPNRINEPLFQFEANQSSFQKIAEKLICSGRVKDGQLFITNADLDA